MGKLKWCELMDKPWIRETLLYERLRNNKVRCGICERRCMINEGKTGFCKTRKNINGKLYTLVYGDISSISANPIEKKPLFHFWPGSLALTVGTWSCNFTCLWCQNFSISKVPPNPEKANYISPEKFVEMVGKYRCQGTSISFNEPTLLFEWSLDVFRLARERSFYNTFVTNGYMTLDALKMLIEAGLDALNVDIKGCKDEVSRFCGANVEYVWRNCIEAKRLGAHVEITTLIVTGVNDDLECLRSIAQRIVKELGENTPWHVTRYYPAYKYHAPPPKVEFLEEVRKIGLEEGLNYVYLGNVPGHPWENTYCPNCGELLIKRYVFDIVKYNLTEKNECLKCGEKVPIIGKYIKRSIVDKFRRFLI